MNSQIKLANLTVAQFWADFNWFGRPIESNLVEASPDPINWQQLDVKTFFGRANWDGRSSYQTAVKPTQKTLSLSLSVEEYFEFSPWRGQPQIAVTPTKPDLPATPSRDFNVTDLANLF
jgi:hypothetical protein